MSEILQIPASLLKYESKANKAIKLIFETQENMSPALLSEILNKLDRVGYLNFAVRHIEAEDLVDLPKIDPSKYDQAKSPSQRLKSVIYLYWKQKGSDGDFNDYYLNAVERLINQYKERLT